MAARNMSISSLPPELVQRIARDYSSTPAEAALALTCRRIFSIIGARSFQRLGRACSYRGPLTFDSLSFRIQSWRDMKREFLQLLARDLPTGYATYCHKHFILHITQPTRTKLERAKFWKTEHACKACFKLPLGAKAGLSVATVQLAARGVDLLEQLVHYDRLPRVTASYHAVCRRQPPRIVHLREHVAADVTTYCRLVDTQVVLAMRYRARISRRTFICHKECTGHKPRDSECFIIEWFGNHIDVFQLHLRHQDLLKVAETGEGIAEAPAGFSAGNSGKHRLSMAPYMKVRLSAGKSDTVLVELDIFASLQQGLGRPDVTFLPGIYRSLPQDLILNRDLGLDGLNESSFIDARTLPLRDFLYEAVPKHFADHEEKLDEVRKSKLRWKTSSARMDGFRKTFAKK